LIKNVSFNIIVVALLDEVDLPGSFRFFKFIPGVDSK